MSTQNVSNLATLIAEKLLRIKELTTKQVFVRNKLEEANKESNALATEINRIEQEVKSLKFEISERLSDNNLRAVLNGE